MKKQDIRDRLNASPSEWNREGVWTKINTPEKKRRRLPFFWWAVGLLVLGIIGMVIFNISDTNSFAGDDTEITAVEITAIGDTENILDLDAKEKSTPIENTIDSIIEQVQDAVSPDGNIEVRTNDAFHSNKDQIGSTVKKRFSFPIDEKESKNTPHKRFDKPSSRTVLSNKTASNKVDFNTPLENNTIGISNRNIIDIFLLEVKSTGKVVFEKEVGRTLDWPVDFLEPRTSTLSHSKHALQFGLGGAIGRHQFLETDRFNRNLLEKNKLGFSSRVRYTRRLVNNWEVSAGVSLLIHKSNFKRSILKENRYIKSVVDDNTYSTTSELRYDYYNYYGFVDSYLGIAYSWNLGRFNIVPNAGLGFNLFSWNRGDVIDEIGNVIGLTEVYPNPESQRMFYSGGLELSFDLNDKYSIGIETTVQNKRNVFSEQKEHQISPISVNVVFSREW